MDVLISAKAGRDFPADSRQRVLRRIGDRVDVGAAQPHCAARVGGRRQRAHRADAPCQSRALLFGDADRHHTDVVGIGRDRYRDVHRGDRSAGGARPRASEFPRRRVHFRIGGAHRGAGARVPGRVDAAHRRRRTGAEGLCIPQAGGAEPLGGAADQPALSIVPVVHLVVEPHVERPAAAVRPA